MNLVLLLALCLPQPQPIRVEIADFNTYRTRGCEKPLTQLILWRWTRLATGYGYHVADWRMVHVEIIPIGDVIRYHDEGQLIELKCGAIKHTNTPFDPEIADRIVLSSCDRQSYFSALRTP